jgi:hypothetical protein
LVRPRPEIRSRCAAPSSRNFAKAATSRFNSSVNASTPLATRSLISLVSMEIVAVLDASTSKPVPPQLCAACTWALSAIK